MSALSPRQMFLLDEACKPIVNAFGRHLYLVGTSAALERIKYRDVDIRLILSDNDYDALNAAASKEAIILLGFTIGEYLASRTSLPIDFQIQRQSEANKKHGGKIRNPIGVRNLLEYEGDAEINHTAHNKE